MVTAAGTIRRLEQGPYGNCSRDHTVYIQRGPYCNSGSVPLCRGSLTGSLGSPGCGLAAGIVPFSGQ